MFRFRRQFSSRDAVAAAVVVTFVALCPCTPAPAVDIKRLVVYLGAPVLLFVCTRSRTTNAFRPEYWSPITLLWLAFVTLNLVATVLSAYPGNSLEWSSWIVVLFLLHLAAAQAFHRARHIDRLFCALVIGTLLTTVYGMVQHCGLDPFPWDLNEDTVLLYARMPASFGNPNLAGHVLMLAIVACAYLVVARRSIVAFAGLVCLIAHLAATGHRGGLIGVSAAACMALIAVVVTRIVRPYAAGPDAAPRTAVRRLAVLIVCSGIVSASFAGILIGNRAWASDPSVVLRANAAYGAARMVLEAPVIGRGPGNYEIESPRYWTRLEQEEYGRRRHYNQHVHNEILQVSVDAGVVAGAVYAALLLTAVCSALYLGFATGVPRRRVLAFAFAALFGGFLVDGCFGFNLRAPASGAVLAVLTGAFDGVFLRRRVSVLRASRCAARWPLFAFLVAAGINALFGARVFGAQYCRQASIDLARSGAFDGATRYATLSQALAPWDWSCAHDAGMVAVGNRDYADAAHCFRRALALNPNHIPTLIAAARACHDIAVFTPSTELAREDSRRYTLRALTLCPVLPEAYENLGLLVLEASNNTVSGSDTLGMAEAYFLRALACGIQDPSRVYFALSEVARRRGDASQANAYMARARTSSAE